MAKVAMGVTVAKAATASTATAAQVALGRVLFEADGEISVEDVRAVVGSLGTEDTYAEEIVTDADLYEDGTVSYATFLAVMAGGEQEHM